MNFSFSSRYQIFVSELNETKDINKTFSYEEYESSNSIYYLAAEVKTNENFPLQYFFLNSKEEVEGLSGQFNTIGKYYLHIRAATLGEVSYSCVYFCYYGCWNSLCVTYVDFFFQKKY